MRVNVCNQIKTNSLSICSWQQNQHQQQQHLEKMLFCPSTHTIAHYKLASFRVEWMRHQIDFCCSIANPILRLCVLSKVTLKIKFLIGSLYYYYYFARHSTTHALCYYRMQWHILPTKSFLALLPSFYWLLSTGLVQSFIRVKCTCLATPLDFLSPFSCLFAGKILTFLCATVQPKLIYIRLVMNSFRQPNAICLASSLFDISSCHYLARFVSFTYRSCGDNRN